MAAQNLKRFVSPLTLSLLLILAKVWFVRFIVLDDANPIRVLALEGPFLLGILLTLDLVSAQFRRWILLSFNLLLSIVFLAIILFASYFDQPPSAGMLSVLGQSAAVKGSIVNLLSPLYFLLFIDLPILGMMVRRGATRKFHFPTQKASRLRWHHTLLFPGLLLGVLGCCEVQRLPLPFDGKTVAYSHGLLVYELSTIFESPQSKPEDLPVFAQIQAKIRDLMAVKTGNRIADFLPGAAKGKNLIVIQVEALQTAVINARIGGREVTPCLNRLMKESWYFPNTATAAGLGATADAEFVVNTSLFPPLRAAASVKYSNRVLPSLPRSLNQQGYHTLTYHTNWIGFWRRAQLYPALGFAHCFDQTFFGNEDRIAFGASDEVLFRKTLNDLVLRFQRREPFFSFIVTMSSHHPFDQIPSDHLRLPLSFPFAGTFTGRYLAAIEYADRALGGFLEELRSTGLLDESVLVVYGDHSALLDRNQPKREMVAHQALLGRDLRPVDRVRVPLFIRMPHQSCGRTLLRAAGQIDIFPSLADVLGLDITKTVHFGRNLFDGGDSMVPCPGFLPPGSYMEGDILYSSGDPFDLGVVYKLSTGEKGSIGLASPAHRNASRELNQISEAYVLRLPFRKERQ